MAVSDMIQILGDTASAQIVASLPPECFAEFDRMLEAAFAFGMSMNGIE